MAAGTHKIVLIAQHEAMLQRAAELAAAPMFARLAGAAALAQQQLEFNRELIAELARLAAAIESLKTEVKR